MRRLACAETACSSWRKSSWGCGGGAWLWSQTSSSSFVCLDAEEAAGLTSATQETLHCYEVPGSFDCSLGLRMAWNLSAVFGRDT